MIQEWEGPPPLGGMKTRPKGVHRERERMIQKGESPPPLSEEETINFLHQLWSESSTEPPETPIEYIYEASKRAKKQGEKHVKRAGFGKRITSLQSPPPLSDQEEMINCKKCGRLTPTSEKFCVNCGTKAR
jgi:hypothetical protein